MKNGSIVSCKKHANLMCVKKILCNTVVCNYFDEKDEHHEDEYNINELILVEI